MSDLKKILIVDDDEDDFIITRSLLEEIKSERFELDWASSFEEGERLLAQNIHDLCLMDYRLGAHDGIQLLKRARDVKFSGPIILFTGVRSDEVDNRALLAGAEDYLVKEQLTAELLFRAIRYALARKGMERERIERIKAESQNKAKNEYLAHLSHELRSPLSAILGFTDILMIQNEDAKTTEKLKIIERNAKHLLGLLNDVLDLSKIEAGRLALEVQEVDLTAFLADLYSLVYAHAVDKNLDFVIRSTEPIPKTITTDATRLRQILLNLLINAIKFTDEGRVELDAYCQQGDSHEMVIFTVRDSGIGISPEEQRNIFQPFTRSSNEMASSRSGSGLGLAICKELVQRLGGTIVVKSDLGAGTEISFSIDAGDLSLTSKRDFNLETDLIGSSDVIIPRLRGRILIVDDLRDILQLVGHFARATGLNVEFAENGADAVRLIQKNLNKDESYDLILMDIHMPIMGGLVAAKKMRELGFVNPIIALTAVHMKGDQMTFLDAGFDAYLSKPVERQRLYQVLQQFMRQKETVVEEELASAPDVAASSNTGSVLVVDDHTDTLEATTFLIESLGYSAHGATSVAAALRAVEKSTIDIAFVDVHLGEESGYELCAKLRAVSPKTRLAILSGTEVDEEQLASLAIDDQLTKPVSLKDIERLLNTAFQL